MLVGEWEGWTKSVWVASDGRRKKLTHRHMYVCIGHTPLLPSLTLGEGHDLDHRHDDGVVVGGDPEVGRHAAAPRELARAGHLDVAWCCWGMGGGREGSEGIGG